MIRALPLFLLVGCADGPGSSLAEFFGPPAPLVDEDSVGEAFLASLMPFYLPGADGRHHLGRLDPECPFRTEWEGGFALDGDCTTDSGDRYVGSYVEEEDGESTIIRYEDWEFHGEKGTMRAHGEQVRSTSVDGGRKLASHGLQATVDVSLFGDEVVQMVSMDRIAASYGEYEYAEIGNLVALSGGVNMQGSGSFWVDATQEDRIRPVELSIQGDRAIWLSVDGPRNECINYEADVGESGVLCGG